MSFITGKHVARRTMLRGLGATVALPFLDAMVPARGLFAGTATAASLDRPRLVCIEMVHGAAGASPWGAEQHLWSPVAAGRDFDLGADLAQPARELPQAPDDRQRHRRPQRRGVLAARDRRRPLPLERRVPDPGASAPDRELGRPRRRLARPDLRAEVRPGHADSVDAAVHRERRSGRRLRLRLLVRLHRHDQLERRRDAAADDPRPADGVRSAVRRRRLGARARPRGARRPPACSTTSPARSPI